MAVDRGVTLLERGQTTAAVPLEVGDRADPWSRVVEEPEGDGEHARLGVVTVEVSCRPPTVFCGSTR